MLIEIIADTICPWCYIGKQRLKKAMAMRPALDFELRWRPFQLNPTMPLGGIERDTYLMTRFGTLDRAERAQDRLRKAGREDGLSFRFDRIRRIPNTVAAHRLLRHSEPYGLQEALVDALYDAYFSAGQDTGEIEALADIAANIGLDRDEAATFLDGIGHRAEILVEDEQVRQSGITGVPCFVIEDEFAVSGAQAPEVFVQIFDLARQNEGEPPALRKAAAE